MMRPLARRMLPMIDAAGRRFGVDARYLAKNSFVVSLAHGVAVLKGIITGYLVTLMFPPEMYGEYKFVLGIVGAIGVIGVPGLPSAIAAAIARKEPVSLQRIGAWLAGILSIGALMILGCIAFLPAWGRIELWPLFCIAALLFVPASLGPNLYGAAIRGTERFTNAFRVSLATNAILTVAVATMLFVRPSSLLLLAFTTGIPAIAYLIALIPFERKFRSNESQKNIKRTAIGLSLATIPSSISWYVDGLLLTAFFGLNQLALFSVALLIPEQVKLWFKELFPIVFSKQANAKDTPERRRKMHVAALIGTFFFAIGIACYVAIAPFIMPILFPQYPAAQLTLLTQVAAVMLIVTPGTIYPQFLEARRMMRETHLCNWIGSIAFLIALFTLIPLYGPLGAILARGIFRLTNMLTALWLVLRTPTER